MFKLKLVSWKEIRQRVHTINAELADIIDAIDPSDDYRLYIAPYQFGQILDDGDFRIQNDKNELEKLSEAKVSKQCAEDLLYSEGSIPAGIVLNGCVEIFLDHQGAIIPRFLYKSGDIFAFMRKMEASSTSFHPLHLMKMSAGARSLFLLPNVGDFSFHKNLVNEFQIHQQPPKNLSDQWHVFSALANHPAVNASWQTELLLFSKKWVEKINSDDPAWMRLKLFVLSRLWSKTGFWRNRMFLDFAFSSAQAQKNLKPNPYLTDTLKHLITIIAGESPGFSIAGNDDYAPISTIQSVYLDFYRLKDYYPVVFQPDYFSWENGRHTYYSLQHPTTYEFSPKSRTQASTLFNLRELKYITESILAHIATSMHEYQNTTLEKIYRACQFDFYHSKGDRQDEIKLSECLLADDPQLAAMIAQSDRAFCANGTFLRGCIKVYHAKN